MTNTINSIRESLNKEITIFERYLKEAGRKSLLKKGQKTLFFHGETIQMGKIGKKENR